MTIEELKQKIEAINVGYEGCKLILRHIAADGDPGGIQISLVSNLGIEELLLTIEYVDGLPCVDLGSDLIGFDILKILIDVFKICLEYKGSSEYKGDTRGGNG